MDKSYIVVIEETWEYHIKVKAGSKKEALEKVDGGVDADRMEVTQHLVLTTAHEERK